MNINYKTIGLIIITIIIVYFNSFRNAFVYDDIEYISGNQFVKNMNNMQDLFSAKYFKYSKERTYRPVCTLTFFTDYSLWKLNVFGWHLTNLLLHAGNAVLVYLILLILLKSNISSALAALFFALHPVEAEVVLGMSFREDLLSLFFYLVVIYLYLVMTGYAGKALKAGVVKAFVFLASVLSYMLAVYSKEMALTLPAILILCDVCFSKSPGRKDVFSRIIKYQPAYWLVILSFLALKYTVLKNPFLPAEYPGGNVFTAMLTMTRGVVHYLKLLLYPTVLNVDYVFNASTSILDYRVLFSIAIIAFIFFVAFKAYSFSKDVSFAILFFSINLLPVSNIIPFGAIIAERYLYFASIGYFMLAGILINKLYKTVSNKKIVLMVVSLLLLFFAARTIRRNIDWKDGFSLWSATLKVSPGSYTVHNNLGAAYKERGMVDEALKEYRKTLELNPLFIRAMNNIGYIYYERGQYDMAKAEYEKAINIEPEFCEAYINLGLVYYCRGMYDKAIEAYNQALSLDPRESKVYSNLIATYAMKKMFDKAIEAFNNGVQVDPGYPDLYKNIGLVYKMTGDNINTVIYWKKYLQLLPNAPDASLIKAEIEKIR